MTQLVYVVAVRGLVPVGLADKVVAAHAGALKSAQRRLAPPPK